MTLPLVLDRLRVSSDALAAAFSAARTTVCEDQPPGPATLPVDRIAEAMVELAGEAETLRDRIRAVVLGPRAPSRSEAQRLVVVAQGALNDIADGLAMRVAAPERRAELARAARCGGAGWRVWWTTTVRGLTECEPALRDVRDSLFACWQELAEIDRAHSQVSSDVGAMHSGVASANGTAVGVAGHCDVSGRVVLSTLAEEPGGGRER